MDQQQLQSERARLLPSGDEPGTAPEDRPFRPDVEGLRAVAVLLVVLYHSGLSALSGGYIGVDVFFVISGFVITGVLLRERSLTGRTSLRHFYGRRCRRIIPAASLVILATVLMSFVFLGPVGGDHAATDGRWAAVFLANFHFISTGVNYLGALRPPSPLQNYWSLAVEEQFYLVYPTLFLVLASISTRLSLRVRLALGIGLAFFGSLTFSILDTSSDPLGAYFSPFTRAWELALGALVAIATPWLLKVPPRLAGAATWLGICAVLVAAFSFNSKTSYPGSLVAIPVFGAALIIAGGTAGHRVGVETLLHLAPFRALGKLSYSFYLWHWPILILAAEHGGNTSPTFPGSLGWVVVALGASIGTYFLVEVPVRHSKTLLHVRWASIGTGVALTILTLGLVTFEVSAAFAASLGVDTSGGASAAASGRASSASLQKVLNLVEASNRIHRANDVYPPPASAALGPSSNFGQVSRSCNEDPEPPVPCMFGDPSGYYTVVLYGDSHIRMWFDDIDAIAKRDHWRGFEITGNSCAISWYPAPVPGPFGDGAYCNNLHHFAVSAINRIDPDLLIVAQRIDRELSPSEWRRGLAQQLRRVTAPKTRKLVLGNEPYAGGPACLATHINEVQACSVSRVNEFTPWIGAEHEAAEEVGARYIDVTPWFCAASCSSVISTYDVYFNFDHVAVGYTRFLQNVLANAIDLPRYEGSGAGS